MCSQALLDHLAAPEDPRQAWKVVHPLPEIMLVVLCATIAAAEDFVAVRRWGCEKLSFLRTMLPFARGIPSHDTLNDVMNALDPALFSDCFTTWVETLREAAPDIVAVERLVLGQQGVDEKGNEIVAIPLLLERLHLAGALVTLDAMGTQTRIAQTILDKGADYLLVHRLRRKVHLPSETARCTRLNVVGRLVQTDESSVWVGPLALKDNWPVLAADVRLFFDGPGAARLDRHDTRDGSHGRIEGRRHTVCRDVGWLRSDQRYPGEPRFPGLKSLAMVEAEVERNGKTSRERRYFLSSLALDAKLLARAVRAHWGIENRLHWVLDVVFHDDLMRLRTDHGPRNMATIKHMAMNLLRSATDKDRLKTRRKAAALNHHFLRAVITRTT